MKKVIIPFFFTSEKLPKDNEYVLIHLTLNNWSDNDDKDDKRYWTVAKFVRGISKEERRKMKNGELPEIFENTSICPTPPGKWINRKSKRSSLYGGADEAWNNKVPYRWETFGPSNYFGQNVDVWARLPKATKLKGFLNGL